MSLQFARKVLLQAGLKPTAFESNATPLNVLLTTEIQLYKKVLLPMLQCKYAKNQKLILKNIT